MNQHAATQDGAQAASGPAGTSAEHPDAGAAPSAVAPAGQAGLLADYRRDLLGVFGDPSLVLVEGSGCRVTDADGTEYLDLLAGIAVNSLGYSHPAWVAAIAEQAARLSHVSNFFTSPQQVRLAAELLEIAESPAGGKVFFTNSGTEANEAALKLIRAHGNAGEPRRHRILALRNAFHGRSAGALAATWKEAYRAPFEPLPAGVEFIEPTLEALEAALGDDVAGVILEPIQGEAGVIPLSEEFLRAARRGTRERGALLVVDEVQTGMGRTGLWLESLRSLRGDEAPDVVTLAKGLGGGFPIGAMLTLTPEATGVLTAGNHGTTFGGNPLAMAAGLATVRTIREEGLMAHAVEVGEHLRAALAGVEGVGEVRGRGLLIAFDLLDGEASGLAPALVAAAREGGFIVNATGPGTVRLAPPLILTRAEADEFVAALPGLLTAARERAAG
ncbi:acetylornithine transaminase [Rothia sp. AR01]|uniref:Acetylornithine transaminase n=1 Tax=Rothia santali TaxID=2949643 RepID=A0A9X2HBV9_9MICC|nr:acetylornithine transaminase [Rothia santali]MCP3425270.1 acetylornithine transaminase [Rothia santali]